MIINQEGLETLTKKMQEGFFKRDRTSIFDKNKDDHSRYVGASLSQMVSNNKEMEAILNWLNNPVAFLYVYGIPGKGKTYFCSACFEKFITKFGLDFYYISEDDFYSKIKTGWEKNFDSSKQIKGFADHKGFIYDDLGSAGTGSTEWRVEMVGDLIDTLYRNETPTLIVSNFTPKEIEETYGKRTASRIFSAESTVVSTASWPDWRKAGK